MRRLLISLTVSGIVALFFFVGLPNGAGSPVVGTTGIAYASHAIGYKVSPCTGFLHKGPYLKIVAGAGCELEAGSTVTGTVTVKPGGSFVIVDPTTSGLLTTISKDLKSDKASFISLTNMTIGGKVDIENTAGFVSIDPTTINEDLKIERTAGPVTVLDTDVGKKLEVEGGASTVDITGGSVGKDLKVEKNGDVTILSVDEVGKSLKVENNGVVIISNNKVVKDLICEKNVSVSGSGNTVGGETKCSPL